MNRIPWESLYFPFYRTFHQKKKAKSQAKSHVAEGKLAWDGEEVVGAGDVVGLDVEAVVGLGVVTGAAGVAEGVAEGPGVGVAAAGVG